MQQDSSKKRAAPDWVPLTEAQIKQHANTGMIKAVVLRGVSPEGFSIHCAYQAPTGDTVFTVLVGKGGSTKRIKCPERAVGYMRRLGIHNFNLELSSYDPDRAFNPARESRECRERGQRRAQGECFIAKIMAEPKSSIPDQIVAAVTSDGDEVSELLAVAVHLVDKGANESSLKALTMAWCDVFLAEYRDPGAALEKIWEFAGKIGLRGEAVFNELDRCIDEEFKTRRKNQHLSTLDV